jgi:hypothetical protein
VEGLPQHPGPLGLAFLLLGLLGGALYAWRIRGHVRSSVGGSVGVGWIVLVLVATTVGAAPFIGWRIVEDIRYTSTIDPWLAPRYGVSVFRVHPEIFDNAAKRIPPGDTYFLAPSRRLDRTTREAFRQWALANLLPRVAVADPDQAQWILTLGVDPAGLGPQISRTWRVKEAVSGLPPAYLGKVAR